MRLKQDEENRRLKDLQALKRKRDLKNSCKPSKVRTYACNDDGYRVIKYFDYIYDFDDDMCVEKVKKRTIKCSAYEKEQHDVEEDEGHRKRQSRHEHKRRRGHDADEHESDVEDHEDEELPKKSKGEKRDKADQFIQKNTTKASLV